MLEVPTGYDASKPYRLIFVWHPLGGSGSQIVSGGFNGLKSLANNTVVFATADGLNGSNSEASGTGYWNANGGDMKLLQVMLDKINAGLCIDQTRIFSTGFSFGGMMSYVLPYEFDVKILSWSMHRPALILSIMICTSFMSPPLAFHQPVPLASELLPLRPSAVAKMVELFANDFSPLKPPLTTWLPEPPSGCHTKINRNGLVAS